MATLNQAQLIKQLMENNVTLQKKATDLLINTNELTKKIAQLVEIFEGAAKRIKPGMETDEVKGLLVKLEELTDQNKTIARGLILLEEYIRQKQGSVQSFKQMPNF